MSEEVKEIQEYIDAIVTTAKLIGYGVLQTNNTLYVYKINPKSNLKMSILELTFQHYPLRIHIHFKEEEYQLDDKYSQLNKLKFLKQILEAL